MNKTTIQEIRNLLLIIGGGAALAIGAVFYLVLYHSPTGSILAKEALLSPKMMQNNLHFSEKNPKTGKNSRFIFDQVQIHSFNQITKKQAQTTLSNAQYRKIFSLIGGDWSLKEVSNTIFSRFITSLPLSMQLLVKTENSAEWERVEKLFQRVDFAYQGDYFRVSLKQESKENIHFAYFYHPNIYQKVMAIIGED